jgi:hypothetical protein
MADQSKTNYEIEMLMHFKRMLDREPSPVNTHHVLGDLIDWLIKRSAQHG